MVGLVAGMRRRGMHVGFLVGNPERNRPRGRPRCRYKISIKMDLREVGCGSIDWTNLAQVWNQ
jgi:hypothetical protein